MSTVIPVRQKTALERLIRIAQGGTGQSRMTAEFLLSWWNAANCGGFDLTTIWGVDTEIAADMVTVFCSVLRTGFISTLHPLEGAAERSGTLQSYLLFINYLQFSGRCRAL
jgi:hypothetical protein